MIDNISIDSFDNRAGWSRTTYLFFTSRLEIKMEITPELLDFTSRDHHIKNIICIPGPSLNAQIVASQNFVVHHEAHALEMVNDPLIEMIAPVRKCVSELSS